MGRSTVSSDSTDEIDMSRFYLDDSSYLTDEQHEIKALNNYFSQKLGTFTSSSIFDPTSKIFKLFIDFLETTDKIHFDTFVLHNEDLFFAFIADTSREFTDSRFFLIFNQKLVYYLSLDFLRRMKNHRYFYPNPFFLKICTNENYHYLYEKLNYFRAIWWIGEKYSIKKIKNCYFESPACQNIFKKLNIDILERRVTNKKF
jgi:hypothetical protein